MNKMTHKTLDSHMQIECMETKSKCMTCNRKEQISEKCDDVKTEQEKREERMCLCHFRNK